MGEGKVMKKKFKYITISVLFLVMGLALFSKYVELKNVVFDGGGIGIYLLDFIQINDKVPNEQVGAYANGFLITSVLFFIGTLYTLYKSFKQKSI